MIEITGMIVNLLGAIVKAVDLIDKIRNKKSNRPSQG